MNVFEAEATLGKRDRRKVGNNTYLERREGGKVALRLHATDVLTFHSPQGGLLPERPACVEYNTGGWFTVTTKQRMNDYGPVAVYSDRGTWYVSRRGMWSKEDRVPYFDGILIDDEGNVLNPLPVDESAKREAGRKAMRRKISGYVKMVMAKLAAGMPAQNLGDCFFCQLHTAEGESLGDATSDRDHLLGHLDEGYVMPSLIWNAVREKGYRYPEVIVGLRETPDGLQIGGGREVEHGVKSSVQKYLTARLIPDQGNSTPMGAADRVDADSYYA